MIIIYNSGGGGPLANWWGQQTSKEEPIWEEPIQRGPGDWRLARRIINLWESKFSLFIEQSVLH